MTPPTTHTPHRLAVFVDIENFAGYCGDLGVPVDITPMLAHLTSQFGRPQIRRSYGDISSLPRPFQPYAVRRMLQQSQFDHIDIPHRPSSYSKNSADIKLVVDAVALIHSVPVTAIAVFSNDRDFIPLFNHAREHGIAVIGCGPSRDAVNEDYLNACDIFLFHCDFVDVPPVYVAPPQPPVSLPEIDEIVAELPALHADQTADVDRLLAAIQSVRADGKKCIASRVSTRMKLMFPDYDVNARFGTFKQFCQEQEKRTGLVKLCNVELTTFDIHAAPLPDTGQTAIPANSMESVSEVVSGNASSKGEPAPASMEVTLIDKYHAWVLRKLKMAMPTAAVREQLYQALVSILQDRNEFSAPITLNELASAVTPGAPHATNVAFRVLYGLFRGRALQSVLTADAYNPTITGLLVAPDQLDSCFVLNMRNTFKHDGSGLPFDESAWAVLMYGAMPMGEALPTMPEDEGHEISAVV